MKRIIVLGLILGALTGCPNNSGSSGTPAPHAEGDGHDHGAETKAHTEGDGHDHSTEKAGG
jgi:hypothetical protein